MPRVPPCSCTSRIPKQPTHHRTQIMNQWLWPSPVQGKEKHIFVFPGHALTRETFRRGFPCIWLVIKMLALELGHISAIPCGPPSGYHVGLPYLHLAKSTIITVVPGRGSSTDLFAGFAPSVVSLLSLPLTSPRLSRLSW